MHADNVRALYSIQHSTSPNAPIQCTRLCWDCVALRPIQFVHSIHDDDDSGGGGGNYATPHSIKGFSRNDAIHSMHRTENENEKMPMKRTSL